MRNIYIKPTNKTPLIELKEDEGYIRIEGRSLPENVRSFYYPIVKEITKIVEDWKHLDIPNFEFHIKLGYFNSSSAKFILDLINVFVGLKKEAGKKIKIVWYYEEEDTDMKEAGQQISDLLEVDFDYIEYSDDDDDDE